MRETALLMPEAAPVSLSSTAVMIAVDSGDTTSAMPSPITAISGKVPVQKLWMPAWVSKASPAKAMATTRLPLAIGKRGPIRSDHWPTGPDSSAIDADSGRKMKPTSAGAQPPAGDQQHRQVEQIGRQREIEEEGRDVGAGEGADAKQR